jgi:hypothetical protein
MLLEARGLFLLWFLTVTVNTEYGATVYGVESINPISRLCSTQFHDFAGLEVHIRRRHYEPHRIPRVGKDVGARGILSVEQSREIGFLLNVETAACAAGSRYGLKLQGNTNCQ